MNYNTSKYSKDLFNIEDNLNEIVDIMNEYVFYDLLISVYCINLCVNNRSALTSQMKLNLALKLCTKNGNKKINTYKEFKNFFNQIKTYIKVNAYDDPILEDFGNVKFKFDSSIYNIIIGTGYNCSYAQLFFLEPLSILTNNVEDVTKVLEYNSNIIDYYKDVNISDNKKGIRIELPTNKLYKRVKQYFNELDFDLTKDINNILSVKNEYIEKQYFLFFEDRYYPLYNTAILIDLFDKMYSKLNLEQRNKVVNSGIYSVLSIITSIDQGDKPYIYFPLKLYNKMSEVESKSYSFLGRTFEGNSIIAINKSEFEEEELIKEIELLTSLAQQDDLKLVEARKRSVNGLHGITITKNSRLKFILYDNYINLCESNVLLNEKKFDNVLDCSALDLVYMLIFSDGMDEIEKFIDYNDQNEYDQIIGFGGDSSRFFTWKSMDHMIAKGAIKFGMINIDINTTDGYVLDYFKDKILDFPWGNSNFYLFGQPFSWTIEKATSDVYLFKNKIVPTFFGYVKYFNNNQLMFFAQNLLFWNKNKLNNYEQITSILDDIILRKIKTCFDYFQNISIASNKSLYFLFVPLQYAMKVGMNVQNSEKIVYSDYEEDELSLNIRFTINYELLYKEISMVKNRATENRFIKELIEPIKCKYQKEVNKLYNYLDNTSNEKKEVEVVQIKLDYIYNNSFRKYKVDDYNYLKAKKTIAEVCLDNNIEPGEYFGKDATKQIRIMQKELIYKFENIISKYNQLDLHTKLLEIYSNCVHEVYIHQQRYTSINNVTDEVLYDVRKNIVEQREDAKRNSRTLLYLIESNLYLKRDCDKIISDEELQIILAFSHWLVNLNDTADICYFTEKEAHIMVNYEYVVDNILDNDEINTEEYIKRIYSKNNYSISLDLQDKLYFDKVEENFDKETNCNLIGIFDICYYLQTEFLHFEYQKLDSNVYKISKYSLIEHLYQIINKRKKDKYPKSQIEKNLEFLIINPEKLKTKNGKKDYFLPFNEREKRDNRFEIKPIVSSEDEIVFSPVLMKNVNSLWLEGIVNFMLPYEIGLPKTRNVILEWKKRYEDKMVYDIKKIFEKNGINFVKVNVQLHKIDKSENYPRDIGDYDVIAIDEIRKNIWIIESKFLNKVGSIYEMFDQQRNFFKENKYIEKFQRRIEYMDSNYKKILRSYGYYDVSNYKVLSYMVFNKVIVSRYRKINFPLISIMELEEKIKSS